MVIIADEINIFYATLIIIDNYNNNDYPLGLITIEEENNIHMKDFMEKQPLNDGWR